MHVNRSHLILEDGIGDERRRARFASVGHGLKRLVVIGSDRVVSFAALRWLADQNASFVMLERDGSVLATTGPARSSDARLRRAQALANENGTAIKLAVELIDKKLFGQEKVARERLRNSSAADSTAKFRAMIQSVRQLEKVLLVEANAALVYWSAWSTLAIQYPRTDLVRIPEHWRVFGARVSPLTGSPRLAVNPPNAILNYLYAILESEARSGSSRTRT